MRLLALKPHVRSSTAAIAVPQKKKKKKKEAIFVAAMLPLILEAVKFKLSLMSCKCTLCRRQNLLGQDQLYDCGSDRQ